MAKPPIVVIGCGVSGLSCAALLARGGRQVDVWTRERPPKTTSNVAAAFWYPYSALPRDRVKTWARTSYERFEALAREPGTGVTMRRALELCREVSPRPWWADAVPTLRQATRDELRPGYRFGWVFDAPVIDTRTYLPYLMQRAEALGVRILTRPVSSLREATDAADVVVNCTGLGSRALCRDEGLVPVRGQLVHVSNPGLDHVLLDEDADAMSYVVPRGDDCVLGGTADEGDDDLAPRPDDSAAIVERCAALWPALATAQRLADVVGLRPGRHAVRVEAERRGNTLVVHNYGHGGAGVTLSWGCAHNVAAIIDEAQ